MIYTVTPNPSLDYTVVTPDVMIGRLNRVGDEHIYPGGKGINVSTMLATLGIPTVALGFVAGETANMLLCQLESRHISSDFIRCAEGMTRVVYRIRSGGVTTQLNGTGPTIRPNEYIQLIMQIDAMSEDDCIIISGSVPPIIGGYDVDGEPEYMSPVDAICKMCDTACKRGVRLVVDTSVGLREIVKRHPFVIKPNLEELSDAFETDITSIDDVIAYGKQLKDEGAVNVLISMGEKGAVLIDETGNVHIKEAYKGTVVNEVCAGDAMLAAFVAEYGTSHDYEKALKMGVATGSATAFCDSLATNDEIRRLLDDADNQN